MRQKFGLKISLDAAAVRKARKGAKHWTTIIVQILCQGVEQGAWGKAAVAHMLEKAQSPDYIAKVRLWQGKDDHANVRGRIAPSLSTHTAASPCPPPPPSAPATTVTATCACAV